MIGNESREAFLGCSDAQNICVFYGLFFFFFFDVALILYASLASPTQFFEPLTILSQNFFAHALPFKNSSFCCLQPKNTE